MPKNVPPEYTGRFSIKRQISPAPKCRTKIRHPVLKTGQSPIKHHEIILQRELSSSSSSSTAISYGRPDSCDPPSSASERLAESYALTPTRKSEQDESPDRGTSPRNQWPHHHDVQLQAEIEITESYKMLEASMARTPGAQSHTPQGPTPSPETEAQIEQEVYLTFAAKYFHRNTAPPAVLDMAGTLAKGVNDAVQTSPAVYIWSILRAIKRFATDSPASIDFLIATFAIISKKFPETMVTEQGCGLTAGLTPLQAWLDEECSGFRGEVMAGDIATPSVADPSDNESQYARVTANFDGVLSKIQEWKQQRTSCIIVSAIQSRAFALDLLRKDDGRQVENAINSGVARKRRGWSKVAFISSCVLLRGCAKSLFERGGAEEAERKRQTLKKALQGLLLEDADTWDDCFIVKAHATVCLLHAVPKRMPERVH
ncbi:MAG: hypothetical protein Q9164_001542 [Protoblastenia rupestris]